jgi:hypothetical protein
MPSINYWNRLEPRPRGDRIEGGLAAEIRDPLWFLTRQWQLGEFRGEDAGSLSHVDIEFETLRFHTAGPADAPTNVHRDAPLELQLQRESIEPDLSTRIELSQIFARLAPEADLDPFRNAFPLLLGAEPRDQESARLLAFTSGRAFDGFALYRAIVTGGTVPSEMDPTVQPALQSFKSWVEDTFGSLELADVHRDARFWRPAELDYRADVRLRNSADAEVSLTAHPGTEGTIDWDSFDLAATMPDGIPEATKVRLIPTHLRFPGMPSPRFWDFESGVTSFPDVNPDRRDTAKLIMLDLMLVHGVDWFVVHLPATAGEGLRVRAVVVRDVFGGDTTVRRGEDLGSDPTKRFTLFTTSGAKASDAPGDLFVLPPTAAATRQTGQFFEEVAFARDEMANIAWAIERFVEGGMGEAWSGHERALAVAGAPRPPPTANVAGADLMYQIQSRVQLNWLPLLPTKKPDTDEVELTLGTVEGRTPPDPRVGRVLKPTASRSSAYVLREEEIPREGVRVRRLAVRTRWTNGKPLLWVERHRAVAGGDSQAGLRFDQALAQSK